MKKGRRNALIVVLVLLLLVFLGYMGNRRGMEDVTGHVIDVQNTEDSGGSPIEPNEVLLNGSSGGDDDGADDGYDSWVPPSDPEPQYEEPAPEKCTEDSCGDGQVCYEGRCTEVECTKDEDCADNDPCIPDVCYFPGHPNAYCEFEPITEKRNNDGCCPPGAWVDTDSDCAPVCGNHKCELGEGYASCKEDCPNKRHSPIPSGGEQGGDEGPYT